MAEAIHTLPGGGRVFAGQRQEGFHVDLGSIFDLGALRPSHNLHLIPMAPVPGINGTQGTNVHSIALQVPITEITGAPASTASSAATWPVTPTVAGSATSGRRWD